MANATTDLSALTTSADVFASTYTLPQIRATHRALIVAIDDKASRLRTQVGSSYRDLLGTADSIVQMRADNDAVQDLLGRMGGRCGRTVVGSKVSGLDKFVSSGASYRESLDMGLVARAKLLEGCGIVVGRILKGSQVQSRTGVAAKLGKGDRLLLASKVLVLSRLLAKSFGKERELDADITAVVDTAKKNLGSLRRRLSRSIKKVLERSVDGDAQDEVLKTLCAYSLATSSGAKDVLGHFLRTRAEAIGMAFEPDDSGRARTSDDVLRGVKLYTRTLLDVQALVPFKLADGLAALKKHPLLADDTMKTIEGLRLDVYERWCGDDIQFFTPFVRHDDLDGPQARSMLTSWAEKGLSVLIRGLSTTMERMTEFKAIMDLRTRVLQLWIRDGGKARGFDPSEMLDALRDALNEHMLRVLGFKVDKLHLVATEVSATIDSWRDGVTDRQDGLWESESEQRNNSFDRDLALGADHFLQELVARLHGRNDAVSKAANCFSSWRRVIDEVGDVVEQLRKQRWDNDVDEIEDEETIEARQQLLSRDDPDALQEKLDASLGRAFGELNNKIGGLWEARADAPDCGKVAMYMIRVVRDVRAGLPKLDADAIRSFGLGFVPSLHEKLAASVSAAPLQSFAAQGLAQKRVVGKALWEGSPELPSQPSPRTFRFLRDVAQSMGDAGMDLWSPAAVATAKRYLRDEICRLWRQSLESLVAEDPGEKKAAGEKNGGGKRVDEDKSKGVSGKEGKDGEHDGKASTSNTEDAKDDAEQQKRDVLIQWLFDVSLLDNSIGDGPNKDSRGGFKELGDQINKHTGLESAEARQRIAESAQGYWKKTGLLFGLLST